MKIAFYTLGCKANQFDTQAMEAMARARGHSVTEPDGDADAYVINTCTVTAVSDKKSRQLIRHVRREHPEAVVAVCGCFSQLSPEIAASIGADVVAGSAGRAHFLELVERAAAERRPVAETSAYRVGQEFELLPSGGLLSHTRALLKVEDGCDNYCSYCIIPYARGHIRSMPPDAAVSETKKLAAAGFREVVVTGIEISSYGADLPDGTDLPRLVEQLCEAAGDMRVHLSSLEPRIVTEDFCRRLSAHENLCPHFHLSLQSGCDETLRRMRRRYDTVRYLESAALLRRYFDNCSLTTDLITGFPGETEREFSETLAFIETCRFADMHIFPYSRRAGTPAASLPDQVPRAVRERRAHEAARAAARMRAGFLASQVGRVFSVLFETSEDGAAAGHTENYLTARVRSRDVRRGEVRRVRAVGVSDGGLDGELQ